MEVDCGFPHLSVYVSLITNLKLNKSMKKNWIFFRYDPGRLKKNVAYVEININLFVA